MIYLDSSVVVAELLGEDIHPGKSFWSEGSFVASRLLQYEVWTRINSRGLDEIHAEEARGILRGVAFLELSPLVLARALEPFPVPVRTLDALHLASMNFLVSEGQHPRLATYDRRFADAAVALDIPLVDLTGR